MECAKDSLFFYLFLNIAFHLFIYKIYRKNSIKVISNVTMRNLEEKKCSKNYDVIYFFPKRGEFLCFLFLFKFYLVVNSVTYFLLRIWLLMHMCLFIFVSIMSNIHFVTRFSNTVSFSFVAQFNKNSKFFPFSLFIQMYFQLIIRNNFYGKSISYHSSFHLFPYII